MRRPIVARWLLLLAAAEAIAFGSGGLVAGLGAGSSLSFAVTAALEVALLPVAQWLVLRDSVPGLAWWRWTVATGSVAALTWGAAIAATSGAEASPAASEPPLVAQVAAYCALGGAAGGLMGAAQWLVLRRLVRPRAWVAWSALAWAGGMPVSSLVVGSVPAGTPALGSLVYGAVAGAGMGLVVAGLLWPGVRRMAPPLGFVDATVHDVQSSGAPVPGR